MQSVNVYLKERFPIPLVVLLALSYTILVGATLNPVLESPLTPLTLSLLGLSFIGFLLRLRITDEFKDAAHDTLEYPNRPLQRGAIDKRALVRIGAFACVIELMPLFFISPLVGLLYGIVLMYSVLTAKEFFASRWLSQHFTVYFVSHQLIFLCFYVWLALSFNASLTLSSLIGLLVFVVAMSLFEIIRKLEYRKNSKGKVVHDSYPAVWGEPATLSIVIVGLLAVGIGLSVLHDSIAQLLIALVAVLGLSIRRFTIQRLIVAIALLSLGTVSIL